MKTFIDHDFAKLKRITNANGRLYETPDGRAYPSVTTITGQYSKQGIMEWRKKVGEEEATRISTRAANRGTRIHYLCEDYLRGLPTNPDIFDAEIFRGITTHLDDINNIHALESPLYSHHLEVAGTVDCVAEYKGKLAVIDFKTSGKLKDREWIHAYFMQTAAYSFMFWELTGIAVSNMIVIIGVDNEDPQIFNENPTDWIDKFITLRREYRDVIGV